MPEILSSAEGLQARLIALFSSLLDGAEVGPDDDFFELGGDSLSVIRLVARLRQQLAVEIVPGDVFDHPTVASLASFLEQQGGEKRTKG